MNWWQSLLIALVPAIITAFISWLISHTQIKNAKKELKEKYENENKLYVSKTRFAMEFDIYKELSEKFVTLVMHVLNLFPLGDKIVQLYENYLDVARVYLNDASSAINKYAIFIPKNWYDRFTGIINLCRAQIDGYNDFYFGTKIRDNQFREDCCKRTEDIKDAFDNLVEELREHINSLGVNKEKKNAN